MIIKNFLQTRFRRKIETQLSDFFSWLIQAMRAGLSLPKALETAALELPPPLRGELEIILERVHRGESLEEALLKTEASLKLPDFSLFVHSVLLLRHVGGNFVEHFENLSQLLRERQKVSEKIRTLTAQGKMQGTLLALFPFFLGSLLTFLSPEFLSPLWETKAGWGVLVVVFLLDIGGWLWIQHWSKVEV